LALEDGPPPSPINPIASFEFENNVLDSTGTNDGTVTGNQKFTTGKIGNNAFDFDGSSFITLANEDNFDFERTDSFSIAFWMKTTSTDSTDHMISKRASGGEGYQVFFQNGAAGLQLILKDASANVIRADLPTATKDVGDRIWHHIVWTYDGTSVSSGVKLYVDGIDRTSDLSFALGNDTLSATILNSESLEIGKETSGASRIYTGQLDDIRIFDIELTESQIKTIAGL